MCNAPAVDALAAPTAHPLAVCQTRVGRTALRAFTPPAAAAGPADYIGASSCGWAQASKLDWASHPGQAVALATLVEYAVATYGRERLPALMAGLGQYESWDTLLPAVYGVSP